MRARNFCLPITCQVPRQPVDLSPALRGATAAVTRIITYAFPGSLRKSLDECLSNMLDFHTLLGRITSAHAGNDHGLPVILPMISRHGYFGE